MSDKNPFYTVTSENEDAPLVLMKEATTFKDTILILAWIASILLIANICWFSTQPLRYRLTVRAVNRVLAQSGDSRRLAEPSSSERRGALLTGSWFTMLDETPAGKRVLVFSFIGEGSFFPCAAVMTQDGKIGELIPLNSHGKKVLERISPGILRIYTKRIEGAGA
jgi:hypothetical protein